MLSKIFRPSIVVKSDKTSLLFWPEIQTSGEFSMIGGVCWPTGEESKTRDEVYGFAVMLGMDIQDKTFYCFEECRFECIDPIMGDGIVFEGSARFFNQCWTSYSARFFGHNHPEMLHKKYLSQTYFSNMISPKPLFYAVDMPSQAQWIQTIQERGNTGRLKLSADSMIYKELAGMEIRHCLSPATKALAAALVAYDRNPYRGKL